MKKLSFIIFTFLTTVPPSHLYGQDWSFGVLSGAGRTSLREDIRSHIGYKVEYFQKFKLKNTSLGPSFRYLYSSLDFEHQPWSGNIESHVAMLGPKLSVDLNPQFALQTGLSYGISRAHLSQEYRDRSQRHYSEASRCKGSYTSLESQILYGFQPNQSLGIGAEYHMHHLLVPNLSSLGSKVQKEGGVFLQDEESDAEDRFRKNRLLSTFNLSLSFSSRF